MMCIACFHQKYLQFVLIFISRTENQFVITLGFDNRMTASTSSITEAGVVDVQLGDPLGLIICSLLFHSA